MSFQLDVEDIVRHEVLLHGPVPKRILDTSDFMLEGSWTQDFVALRNDPPDVSLRKKDLWATEGPCEGADKTVFAILEVLLL